jgi:hypothetical protein
MTTANGPQSGGAPVQPWTPGAAPTGVTCPACGLTNEAGARTCRNCGLPIAAADDPVRGVAPGRVDLPRTRRSGFSATIGFVLVVALLLVGGSLAISGGGGILSGGGRLIGPAETATPTPAPVAATTGDETVPVGDPLEDEPTPKATTANMDTFSCENGAIKDLSRGRWFLTDVKATVREDEDGSRYDQVYWRLDRQNPGKKVKAAKATTVSMRWTTPDAAKERYGDAIGRVQGDRAIEIVFDGPVKISVNGVIEQSDLVDSDIDQLRRIQLFERNGRVRTVIGLKGDACARLGSVQWGAKSKKDNARVVLDVERFD